MKLADTAVSLSSKARLSGYFLMAMALLSSAESFWAMDAMAQSFGSRTSTVAVAEATENTLSIFPIFGGASPRGR